EVFVLSKIVDSCLPVTPATVRRRRRDAASREDAEDEEILLNRPIFVGVPSAVGDLHDHEKARTRVLVNLPSNTTEASLRSKLHTAAGPTKSIRMLVGDFDTGEFGGAAAVEFTSAKNAENLSGAKLEGDILVRQPTAREWAALGEGDWPGLSYGRIDPEIQKSLCSADPPDEPRHSPLSASDGSWARAFADQKASRWAHHRLQLSEEGFSIFMLLWRLQPLLFCLALPAATVDESIALQMISEAAAAGRSIRDMVTPEEMEKWINNQWWDAALAAIKLDHEQQPTSGKRTDYFGPPVRKAAREIKARADELVRSLDQNYFRPQRVAPAFQWAQNDTAVFINVKFTRRWNA
ncbi:hypothetical protein FOZ63_006569, partial [Perkinsus olseni]